MSQRVQTAAKANSPYVVTSLIMVFKLLLLSRIEKRRARSFRADRVIQAHRRSRSHGSGCRLAVPLPDHHRRYAAKECKEENRRDRARLYFELSVAVLGKRQYRSHASSARGP